MSSAPRPARWRRLFLSCAGQSRLGQRVTASSSSRTTAEPHTGQRSGKRYLRAPRRALLLHHLHDLRDHVAGALHDDRVAHAHVLALDLVAVVERRVRDRDAAHAHGLELRHRRERAGAADLHLDREHASWSPARAGTCRPPPSAARATRSRARSGAASRSTFTTRAVDLDRQRRALREQRLVRLDHRVDAAADAALGAGREAPAGEQLEHLRLRLHAARQSLADRVRAQLERAQPVAVGVVELAQRSGRGVARIRERLEPAREAPRVQALEARRRQHDLAAHRDAPGRLAVQRERNARREAQVRGDVLADAPVAARRARARARRPRRRAPRSRRRAWAPRRSRSDPRARGSAARARRTRAARPRSSRCRARASARGGRTRRSPRRAARRRAGWASRGAPARDARPRAPASSRNSSSYSASEISGASSW